MTNQINIEVFIEKVFYILLSVLGLLVLAHLGGIFSRFVLDHDVVFGLIRAFDLNLEKNIPTFFSVFLLLLASVLLGFVSLSCRVAGMKYKYWLFLALLFLFLSYDEYASFHEGLNRITKASFGEANVPNFAWVVPYSLLLFLLLLTTIPFLKNLPSVTRNRFLLAGAVFVGSAVGIELVQSHYHSRYAELELLHRLSYVFEEGGEMLGVTLFIRAILHYIRSTWGELHIVLRTFT